MAASRIHPDQAYRDLESGAGAILVCAYDDEEKFRQNRLAGAISMRQFRAEEDLIPKNREIIFY